MNKINDDELKQIEEGGIGWGLILGGVVTFLIGIFDGITRPLACH